MRGILTVRVYDTYFVYIRSIKMFPVSYWEVTNSRFRLCGGMTFSDALPVQWWLADCETFNEHEAGGILNQCWCQPWNCDMPIPVQFRETTGGDYSLKSISEEGVEITQSIDEVLPGVYQTIFYPSENSPDFCAGKIKLQVINNVGGAIEAKTDCLEVAMSHDEVILAEYSNNRNYAGIVYEDQSPDLSFSILIPGRFFHEREPEEDNEIELTSSVVTTSSSIKTQRLLEIKHSPYYFHKKVRRVLKHQSLTILNKSWKKEEGYEVIAGNMRWPLKAATVYLTETNSVVRNIL